MNRLKYNCVFFFENRQPAKYRNVSNIRNLWQYVERNLDRVKCVNLYYSDSKRFYKQVREFNKI